MLIVIWRSAAILVGLQPFQTVANIPHFFVLVSGNQFKLLLACDTQNKGTLK